MSPKFLMLLGLLLISACGFSTVEGKRLPIDVTETAGPALLNVGEACTVKTGQPTTCEDSQCVVKPGTNEGTCQPL